MKTKTLDLDFFRECGRRGGRSRSDKKIKAIRKNIRRAIATRWPRKEKP